MKINEEFLEKYLNSNGPVGFEYELGTQRLWVEHMKKFSNDIEIDVYGSACARLGNVESDYKVVIEAHVDEISWLVSYIDKSGYIRVVKNGGSDTTIAPSMRITLWGDKGPINGIFGHPAIHIKDRKTEATIDSIFIDVGANSRQGVYDMGISVGCPVTFQDGFMRLGDNYYTGRALDNRLGGFIISEVCRKLTLNKIKLPYQLYVVNSVQEEVGLRGAKMMAEKIKPNVAIVVDVCHETSSPAYSAAKQGEINAGDGGVITRAPSIQNNLRKLIIDSAIDNKLKYQLSAKSGSSGTDADAFAYANGGIATALISIPLKYMHTTCETAHKKDVKSVIEIIYNSLLRITENQDFGFRV